MVEEHQPCPEPEQISAQLDGDLDAADAAAVAAHLETCASCAQLHADLVAMRGALPSLAEVEPSQELWREIARRHDTERRPSAFEWLRRWWMAPALGLAGAAALVLLLLPGEPEPASEPVSRVTPELAMETVRKAERQYIDAIAQLEQAVDLDRAAPRPEVRQSLQQGLAEIDRSIRRCRSVLHEAPDDLAAQEIMLAAYQQKVDFLSELLDSSQRPRGAANE